jgi:hypothetical protein
MTSTSKAVPVAALVGACLLGVVAGCAGAAPKSPAPPPAAVAPPPAPPAPPPPAASAEPAPAESATPPPEPAPVAAAPADSAAPEAPASSAPPTPPTPPTPAAPAPAPRILLADELPYVPAHLRAHDAKPEHHHAREASAREPGKRPYHPAPGIVVDVVAAEGGSSADLQRVARNLGYWPFRQCYEEGLRRDPRLSGKVSLEVLVSPSGGVDRSTVTAATVHDEIVAACIAREAKHIALPGSESPVTAKVDVSLALGDEPVPTGRPVPNAEKLRDALRGSWGGVRRCYAGAVASRPSTGGRLELRFRVRHGEIAEVSELGGEGGARFGDSDVTRCVVGVYRAVHLPAAVHATHERSFVYALQLESIPAETAAP